MAWNPQGGGPSGGNGQGPWGPGSSGPQLPDIEDILRKGQDRFKQIIPGGMGSSKGIILVVAAALLLWSFSGMYRIQPSEQGVVLWFGEWVKTTGPGLHYNFPAPIGTVYKPEVTRVNRVQVGFRSGVTDGRTERARDVPQESLMLTGDENIIDVMFVTFWRIKDAGKFLFNIRNPAGTVKDASESAMREIIGKTGFEYARTTGRGKVEQEAQVLIQTILDDYGAGIEVTNVQMQKIDPPGNVLDAFRDVQAARADKERAINEATAYLNEVVQRAEGSAQQIIKGAEAYKEQKVAIATGEARRFLEVYGQYRLDKDITKRRLYLETMKSVMADMDKVLIDNSAGGTGVVPYLPLNELGKTSGGTGQ